MRQLSREMNTQIRSRNPSIKLQPTQTTAFLIYRQRRKYCKNKLFLVHSDSTDYKMISFIYYFVTAICPALMLILGIVCNLVVIKILTRKRFQKVSSTKVLCLLAINDMFSIMTIIIYHGDAFKFNAVYTDKIACKVLVFLYYEAGSVAGWTMCLVNLERLIAIRFTKIQAFVKMWTFILIVFIIYVWNGLIYGARAFYVSLFIQPVDNIEFLNISSQSGTVCCDIEQADTKFIFAMIDLINSTLVPFVIMIVCSCLIIRTMNHTKKKIMNKTKKEKGHMKRDLQFSVVILSSMCCLLCSICRSVFTIFLAIRQTFSSTR